MELVKQRRLFRSFLWYLGMAVVAVIFCLPMIWMFFTAFKAPQQTVAFPPEWIPDPWTMQNFVEGFQVGQFGRYFLNSAVVSLLVVIGTVCSSSLVAFGFARLRARGKGILFVIVLGTMMIPSNVTLIPVYYIYSRIGWVNTILPLTVPAFLGGGAFSIFLLKQFFETLPKELAESAMIDGCSWIKIFLRIFIPNAKPALIVVIIFAFVNTWNDFFNPMIFLNDPDKFTIAIGLAAFKNQYGGAVDMGPLMAMSLISVLPILILFVGAQKYFVQGIATTGIK